MVGIAKTGDYYYIPNITSKTQFTNYIQHFAKKYNYEWSCEQYREECWRIWSTKYRHIDPIFIIHIGVAETYLRHWGISSADAHGPWQIRPRNWMHLLWYVDDGKLAKRVNLNTMSWEKKVEFFHYINYNFEMACMIVNAMLKKYAFNYEVVLLAYNYGDENDAFRWKKNNLWSFRTEPYYKEVFRPFPYLCAETVGGRTFVKSVP